jgi:hypothetical protein
VSIRVLLPPPELNPREYREAFAASIRAAIDRAYASHRIDVAHAEELYRVLPEREPRQ